MRRMIMRTAGSSSRYSPSEGRGLGTTSAALAADEPGGQHDVPPAWLRTRGGRAADHRVQGLERRGAEILDGLADAGQPRVEVPGHRYVVKARDGYLAGHVDAAAAQRVQHADGGLVIRADDRARQVAAVGQQPLDDPGAAGRAVVTLPLRPVSEPDARLSRLLRRRLE